MFRIPNHSLCRRKIFQFGRRKSNRKWDWGGAVFNAAPVTIERELKLLNI
jgi:hypothetical protein